MAAPLLRPMSGDRQASDLGSLRFRSPLINRSHRKHLMENCLPELAHQPLDINHQLINSVKKRAKPWTAISGPKYPLMWWTLAVLLCAGNTVARPNSTSATQHQDNAVSVMVPNNSILFRHLKCNIVLFYLASGKCFRNGDWLAGRGKSTKQGSRGKNHYHGIA